MHQVPNWYFDSMQHKGIFRTREALKSKVDEDGNLKPFKGETAVFLLPDNLKEVLADAQNELYESAGKMLMKKPLSRESLHMTLHDLWNEGDMKDCAFPPYEADEVCRIIEGIRRDFPQKIMMRAIVPMSMVETSVVMGLVPASEVDGWRLSEMHNRLSAIYPRDYGFTPHITLAYYRPGDYEEDVWTRLRDSFRGKGYDFPLYTKDLVFQRFCDMENYETVY